MTLVYRDPTILASALAPLVDLADKIVRLQRELDSIGRSSPLRSALRAAEDRIAEHISKVLPAASEALESIKYDVDRVEPVEGNAVQTFKVGDRVRVARESVVWIPAMTPTLGQVGIVSKIDEDAFPACARVTLTDGDWWWYSAQDLDLVSDRTTAEDSK